MMKTLHKCYAIFIWIITFLIIYPYLVVYDVIHGDTLMSAIKFNWDIYKEAMKKDINN